MIQLQIYLKFLPSFQIFYVQKEFFSYDSQFSEKQMISLSYTVEWVRSRYISQEQVLVRRVRMCRLKNTVTTWKQKVILLGGNVNKSKSGRQHLSISEKTVQGGRRGSQGKSGYTSLHQGKQAVWKAKIRYTVKESSVLWEGAASDSAFSGKAQPLGSLSPFLSQSPQPSAAALLPCSPCPRPRPAPQPSPWGWRHPLGRRLGSLHSHLDTRNHWCLWCFTFMNMAGDIHISQSKKHLPS